MLTSRPRVAVIDSGIARETRTDGWLDDVVRRDGQRTNVDTLNRTDEDDDDLTFSAGHGTFVAGIVAQVCPEASITAYRPFVEDGVATEVDVAGAIVTAAREGADIINLSMGCHTEGDREPLAFTAAMSAVRDIETADGREIVVVAAAGNFGDARPTWPAAMPAVVAVASVDPDLTRSPWSTWGPWIDVATIARGVLSTYVAGSARGEDEADVDEFGVDAFARWTGTSFAAPQISGAVAQEMCRTGSPARAALHAVLSTATPAQDDGPPVLLVLPGL